MEGWSPWSGPGAPAGATPGAGGAIGGRCTFDMMTLRSRALGVAGAGPRMPGPNWLNPRDPPAHLP